MMGKTPPAPEITTLLGEGARFEGQLSFDGVVRIDGHFKGKIDAKNATLIIGESGRVEADGALSQFIVAGHFHGSIQVSGLTRIQALAGFDGQLETGLLVTEEGALLNAQITMQRRDPAGKNPPKK